MFHKPVLPHPHGLDRVTVMQGQALASGDKNLEYSTVLGSCVATCLYDPEAHVGGMNHFLLAEPPPGYGGTSLDEHYGLYLMELLINEMMAKGARKSKLKAHLYGGANVNRNMMKIGTVNAEFARRFLKDEGIVLMREDLGGTQARRVDFRPASGQVRLRTVEDRLAPPVQPTARPAKALGDVDFF
jgi:chemotaxis protein CheD